MKNQFSLDLLLEHSSSIFRVLPLWHSNKSDMEMVDVRLVGEKIMRRAYLVHPIGGARENSSLQKKCRLARQNFGA